MQKFVKKTFFCYPKNQNISILYDDVSCLSTQLFKALSLQVSAKEGVLLRLRKTKFGHHLSAIANSDKLEFLLPQSNNISLGYKSGDKTLFFCFDNKNNPAKVVKKSAKDIYIESDFLGYSIIEKYSKKEFFKKKNFIELAFNKRWTELLNKEVVHGDFTHFNVLLSVENEISFIDSKETSNSILFDFFYFYSYYLQCLKKCKTISNEDVLVIKKDLQKMIKEICKSNDLEVLLKKMNVQNAIGLYEYNREIMKSEFINFMLKNEE